MRTSRFALPLATLVLIIVLAACATPAEQPPPEPVTVGITLPVGADPSTAALLEPELEGELGRPVNVQIVSSFTDLAERFAAGELDFAHFGPLQTADVIADTGAAVAAIAVRGGATTYRTQFNVRCELGASSLEDLTGLRFAFVSSGSTSGHMVPYVTLLDASIDPETELTTSFAGSHDAVVLGIYQGDLDAGASFEDAREAIAGDHPDVNDVVCVLGYSDPIPNDAVVAHSSVAPALVQAVGQALITLSNDTEAQATLQAALGASEFAAGTDDLYDILRRVSEVFY